MNARFWPKVDRLGGDGSCWEWSAGKNGDGYGIFHVNGRALYAHRVAYETRVGPIPDGMQLDHLCRVRHCVNPSHLEPVSNRTNSLRGVGISAINARKTSCDQGHAFTEENTYRTKRGRRECRTCKTARQRARRQSLRELAA